ncbi:hypothetical protein KP78_17950 [Jeotgalibacillus soli]|uniref:protein-tyrosine-phosphatase n=2 Tax=Jeotgalibacillus soli TaxID=889306 RepID=A0A0C2VE60_9BACL|nr:hypothetical protein KP78_17950 [Jeotgalibacillus soli]
MAEAIFHDMIKKEGLEHRIDIDSAGTGHWYIGKAPHRGTLELLKNKGISGENLKARQLERRDLEEYDYIIAMDQSNRQDIEKLARAADKKPECLLLLELIQTYTTDVPDPYYSGNFEEVFDLLQEGCASLLEHIKKKHKNQLEGM